MPLGLLGKKGPGGEIGCGEEKGRMGCGVFAVPNGRPLASLNIVILPKFCELPNGSPLASL